MKGRHKSKQELNEGSSPKCKMYLQRDVIAHWLAFRGIFVSLQACERQTWKEREINQCSETRAQPTATCSSSLKDKFVFLSSDNSSFPHCGFSQMWCKAPASPSLLLTSAKIQDKGLGGNKEFLLQLNSPLSDDRGTALPYSFRPWLTKAPRLTDSFFISPRALGFSWRKFFLVRSFAVKRMLCGDKLKSQLFCLLSCSSSKIKLKKEKGD